MSQVGFTPIKLYRSSTTTNVPLAANLNFGELAINYTDGKLFYKDNAGVVQVLGTKGGVGSSTNTQVLFNSGGLVAGSANVTFDGTKLQIAYTGITNYADYTPISQPSYTQGRMWYDSTAKSLAYFNDVSSAVVHVGQDLQVKVINNTGSTIANGAPVYVTGTSSGQTYPNIALAKADVAGTSSVIGLTNGSIANGAVGYVTAQGGIDNVNTGSYTVGQVLYLSPYSAGQLMNTIPPTGITVQVGVVTYVDTSAGKIYVKQTTPLNVPASIISGQVAVANGGTGASTASAARTNLSAAQSGANTDITSIALTTGTISATPSGNTDIVNKLYADSIATGINFHAAANLATTASLFGAGYTYNNGTSGVGATITYNSNAALSIDGSTPSVGNRILVKNEVGAYVNNTTQSAAFNGVYTVTAVGSGAAPWVLTRATDYDTSGSGTNEIDQGDFILVLSGSTNANTSWVQQTALPITVGTTSLVFSQFAAGPTYPISVANGGTGANTVAGAQTNLQVDPAGTAIAMAIALG